VFGDIDMIAESYNGHVGPFRQLLGATQSTTMPIASEPIASGTLASACGAPETSATTAPAGSEASNNRMLVSKFDRMQPRLTWRRPSLLINAPTSDDEIGMWWDLSLYQALA
jgi:hypothetical protein